MIVENNVYPIMMTRGLLSHKFDCRLVESVGDYLSLFYLFLVSFVEETPWWPIQSPNKGRRKQNATRRER